MDFSRLNYYELAAEGQGYYHFEKKNEPAIVSHFHGAGEFLFVEKGEQTVIIGGEKRTLKAGDACFSGAFCVHSYPPSGENVSWVLLGENQFFTDALSAFQGKQPPKFFRFNDFELLEILLRLSKRKYEKDGDRVLTFEGILKILLARISENTEFIESGQNKQDFLICDLLQYAETHYTEDLSLKALARVFGYSHEHLSRIIHKYLLENWNVYTDRLRAKKVWALLKKDPSLPVLKAAFFCGFESANTFYRAYKREFGEPPKRK